MVKSRPEIVEEEQGYKDSSLSPKQIILKHIDRISKYIFSGEQEPTTKITGREIVKTQDKRVIIIQAIEFLTALLDTHYDKQMKNAQKKFDETTEKGEKDFITTVINTESYKRALEVRNQTQRNKRYKEFQTFFKQHSIIPIDKSAPYYERYLSIKYYNYMNLFKEQNSLLKRINYLEGMVGEE